MQISSHLRKHYVKLVIYRTNVIKLDFLFIYSDLEHIKEGGNLRLSCMFSYNDEIISLHSTHHT